MLRVGLTGSIAVGKSFVASVFTELGCHVLDADQTAREVVMPGTPGLAALTDAFGKEILNPDGTLNRKQLGAVVFGDEAKRQRLNHILHPFIIARKVVAQHQAFELNFRPAMDHDQFIKAAVAA